MTFRQYETVRVYAAKRLFFSPWAGDMLGPAGEISGGFEAENLYRGFRNEALEFFETRKIQWHKGVCDKGVASSRVLCVNCLFPFSGDGEGLGRWLGRVYPDVAEALPVECPAEPELREGGKPFVTFDWIGERNFLDEPYWGNRGRGCTSADAVFRYRARDGRIHVVLAEWMYCEEAGREYLHTGEWGLDRLAIYRPLLGREGCQIEVDPAYFGEVMIEPYDSLMRLQFLASALERSGAMEADVVSVLLVAPEVNPSLLDLEAAGRIGTGGTVGEVWEGVVVPGRFRAVATEDLIPAVLESREDGAWRDYIGRRYVTIVERHNA